MGKKTRLNRRQGGGGGVSVSGGDNGLAAPMFSAAVLVILSIVISIILSTTNNQIAIIVLLSVFVVFLLVFIGLGLFSVSSVKTNQYTNPYVSMFSWSLYGLALVVGELIFITAKYKHYTPALIAGIVLTSVSVIILMGLLSSNTPDSLNTTYSAQEAPDSRLLALCLLLVFSAATSLIVAFFPQNYISTDGGGGGGGGGGQTTYA